MKLKTLINDLFEAPMIDWNSAIEECDGFIRDNLSSLRGGVYPWSAQICEAGSFQVHRHQTSKRTSTDLPVAIDEAANSFFEKRFHYAYRDNAKFCSTLRLNAKNYAATGMNKRMCIVLPMGRPWSIVFSPKVKAFELVFSPDSPTFYKEQSAILGYPANEIWNGIFGTTCNADEFAAAYAEAADRPMSKEFERFIHGVLEHADYQKTNYLKGNALTAGNEFMLVSASYLVVDAEHATQYTDAIEATVNELED